MHFIKRNSINHSNILKTIMLEMVQTGITNFILVSWAKHHADISLVEPDGEKNI